MLAARARKGKRYMGREKRGKFGVMSAVLAVIGAAALAVPMSAQAASVGGTAAHTTISRLVAVAGPAPVIAGRARIAAAGGPPAICAKANPKAENRKEQCTRQHLTFTVTRFSSDAPPVVIGTGSIEALHWNILNPLRRTWTDGVQVTMSDMTGVVSSFATTGDVTLGCSECDASEPSPPFLFEEGVPIVHEFTVRSPGKAVAAATETPTLSIDNADADSGPASADLHAVFARCDSEHYFSGDGGCVNDLFKPTFKISLTGDAKEVAAHIKSAQDNPAKGHWGLEGDGKALRRATEASVQAANRKVACPASRKPPKKGLSCDEYPFASTHEGAGTNSEFSWAWVDAAQNSLAGSQLAAFYQKNRVIEDDEFWVAVTG
jgi:hypothetical protein